jgi:hypothetical protein
MESWDKISLPRGLEVTLAAEPPAEGTDDEDVFQRVLYLPGSEQTPDMPNLSDWVEEIEPEIP